MNDYRITDSSGEKDALRAVTTFYKTRINPTPSDTYTEELGSFVKDMDADVIIKAMEYAIDQHKTTWPYVRALLKAYKAQGIRTLADLQRANNERQRRQEDNSAERVKKAIDQILAISSQLHLTIREFEDAVEGVRRYAHIG